MKDLSDDKVNDFIENLEEISSIYMKTKAILFQCIRTRTLVETSSTSNDCLRLPKLDVLKFNGNIDEWYKFKDQYTSIIYNNTTPDNTRKMYYLKSCLSGNVSQITAYMSSVGSNYAWSPLNHRYDNKILIIQSYVQNLLS